jgi:hypothetical protein
VTDTQLYLAIGVLTVFNTVLLTMITAMIDKRMGDRFHGLNQRFDDMRDLWRAELHRVEEVLSARLKHIEPGAHLRHPRIRAGYRDTGAQFF